MAETIGSLVDKISIIELKIFHTGLQTQRRDVSADHLEMCERRLSIMRVQRDDLVSELNQTVQAWSEGKWTPKVYRQFKMYNDPRFRTPVTTQKP